VGLAEGKTVEARSGFVIEVNRIIAFQMRAEKTTWLIRFTEMFRRL